MNIYIGTDHAGFDLKEKIKKALSTDGFPVIDMGAEHFDETDDYNEFIVGVVNKVKQDDGSFGIILGGSGSGEAIQANRIKGVRATVFYGGDIEMVRLSRQHNDANVLSLGARFIKSDEALKAVKIWLDTPFSDEERHIRRNNKLDSIV